MDAWTDLNQIAIRSRIQDRTNEAAAERLARASRFETDEDRPEAPVALWTETVAHRQPVASRS
jgi:hypothetical protein